MCILNDKPSPCRLSYKNGPTMDSWQWLTNLIELWAPHNGSQILLNYGLLTMVDKCYWTMDSSQWLTNVIELWTHHNGWQMLLNYGLITMVHKSYWTMDSSQWFTNLTELWAPHNGSQILSNYKKSNLSVTTHGKEVACINHENVRPLTTLNILVTVLPIPNSIFKIIKHADKNI